MGNFIFCAVILISAILMTLVALKNSQIKMEILAVTIRTKINSIAVGFINSNSITYKWDKLSEGSKASTGAFRTLSNTYDERFFENI